MHTTLRAPATARPLPGDFLIYGVPHCAGLLLVGPDRDHPQLSCQTYESALAHAERAAASDNVDVWHTRNGARFERLVRHRHIDS